MFGLIRRAAVVATVLLAGAMLGAALAAIGAGSASAQDRRQNQPGQFDFYVLALSWSPSFCEASAERGRTSHEQCGPRPFSFVVHGLWPQYERGFPEYCQNPAPRLDRNIVASMLDLMPARRLIFNEWDKHGVCTGLGPRGYFEAVRKARAGIKIPEPYMELSEPLTVTPGEVEAAFVEANPGMSLAGISVTCDSRRLHEVRICLTKDLRFRDCEQLERRSCRRERLVMPPVRGAASN
jgi:ribonuclease T2